MQIVGDQFIAVTQNDNDINELFGARCDYNGHHIYTSSSLLCENEALWFE